MTRSDEIRPDLDEGIDRQVLNQLRTRFLKLNRGRLARAQEGLSTRQQLVLKLLPLLFHVNHPLLPGYVCGATPAGLSLFEPDAQALAEAQRLTRSFSYKARKHSPRPIHGLFLMGSLGTLAQTEESDMDVWVCHDGDLGATSLEKLRKKCQLLENWAETQGAEAHFFLIDAQRFARGERDAQLSSEDCGTTQHYLLLDEFYRTAIWLAGRTPIWWLVPVYEEPSYNDYTHRLLSRRFIRADETLDLGHLAHIPPAEFLGAGLWQLFKGIESPYKSVLKLLLTEVYASQYPQVQCLSLRYKQAVFANRLDLDELDPYVAVYRQIEEYLTARGETERLELIRRCLYLKVNKKLTAPSRQHPLDWQRQLLGRLARQWGWDEAQLTLLDSRRQWKVRQVISERRALVNELNHSYCFLGHLAATRQVANQTDKRDLSILGRRLYAAFGRKAGKIELINPGIVPDLAEDTLTLVQRPNRREPGQTFWGLYNGTLNAHEWENFTPFKRCDNLVQLLAWAHRNGVIDNSTRLALHPGTSDLSESELSNLLASVQQTVPLPLEPVDEASLLRRCVPTQALFLINVGVDPLKHHRELNILMTTQRTDSLSYAGARENLVLTLDQVTLNSWNEMLVSRHAGPHALFDCLRDHLRSLAAATQPPRITVRCFCHNRAPAIAARVEEIVNTAQALLDTGLGYRYLLQVQERFHLLDLTPGHISHRPLADEPALLEELSQPRSTYSPVHLDQNVLQEHDLALILAQGQPECTQVFYRRHDAWAQVYVLDPTNRLWHRRLPCEEESSLQAQLHDFVQSTLARRDRLPAPVTLCYQILPAGQGRAQRLEQQSWTRY